ncbi:MAG: hypothetical protein OCC49_19870 [Fibrobacterales bacterium]
MFYILTLTIWIVLFFKNGIHQSSVSISKKIQFALITLIIVGLNSTPKAVLWIVANFNVAVEHYSVRITIMPPKLTMVLCFLATALQLSVFIYGIAILNRNNLARINFLKLFPALIIILPVEMAFGFVNTGSEVDNKITTIFLFVFYCFTIGLFYWIKKYFTNEQVVNEIFYQKDCLEQE